LTKYNTGCQKIKEVTKMKKLVIYKSHKIVSGNWVIQYAVKDTEQNTITTARKIVVPIIGGAMTSLKSYLA